MSLKRWFVICLLALSLSACSLTNCSDDPACKRVLFIGNSYTYVNDLPNTLVKLAQSGGQRLEIVMAAPGGWSLSDHLKSSETLDQIKASKWNFVVLQEQSMVPASDPVRNSQMYPAARGLNVKIKENGARLMLFDTWGHKAGWPENGMPDYESMQAQINYGYQQIAQELNVSIAPAGYAWLIARRQNPQWNLWQEDGSHPTAQGTYLTACVFYAALFRQSPVGLSYAAHLPQETARSLQVIAANVVLQDPQQWNLR